jgi:hypothetical protein
VFAPARAAAACGRPGRAAARVSAFGGAGAKACSSPAVLGSPPPPYALPCRFFFPKWGARTWYRGPTALEPSDVEVTVSVAEGPEAKDTASAPQRGKGRASASAERAAALPELPPPAAELPLVAEGPASRGSGGCGLEAV